MLKKKRKKNIQEIEPVDDIRNFDFIDGFGSVFIFFKHLEESKKAKHELNLRVYDGRIIESAYWSEELF